MHRFSNCRRLTSFSTTFSSATKPCSKFQGKYVGGVGGHATRTRSQLRSPHRVRSVCRSIPHEQSATGGMRSINEFVYHVIQTAASRTFVPDFVYACSHQELSQHFRAGIPVPSKVTGQDGTNSPPPKRNGMKQNRFPVATRTARRGPVPPCPIPSSRECV